MGRGAIDRERDVATPYLLLILSLMEINRLLMPNEIVLVLHRHSLCT